MDAMSKTKTCIHDGFQSGQGRYDAATHQHGNDAYLAA
jgi:hypothetical protein